MSEKVGRGEVAAGYAMVTRCPRKAYFMPRAACSEERYCAAWDGPRSSIRACSGRRPCSGRRAPGGSRTDPRESE
eukprot:3431299-Pleurochrysis_carterae.AAC.1